MVSLERLPSTLPQAQQVLALEKDSWCCLRASALPSSASHTLHLVGDVAGLIDIVAVVALGLDTSIRATSVEAPPTIDVCREEQSSSRGRVRSTITSSHLARTT